MFRNLVTSLLEHERIETTEAKAKEIRGITEKMITLGKTALFMLEGAPWILSEKKRLYPNCSVTLQDDFVASREGTSGSFGQDGDPVMLQNL